MSFLPQSTHHIRQYLPQNFKDLCGFFSPFFWEYTSRVGAVDVGHVDFSCWASAATEEKDLVKRLDFERDSGCRGVP